MKNSEPRLKSQKWTLRRSRDNQTSSPGNEVQREDVTRRTIQAGNILCRFGDLKLLLNDRIRIGNAKCNKGLTI